MSFWQWSVVAIGSCRTWNYHQRYVSMIVLCSLHSPILVLDSNSWLWWNPLILPVSLSYSPRSIGPGDIYSKHPVMVIPTLEGRIVFVHQKFVHELYKAPDVLSLQDGPAQVRSPTKRLRGEITHIGLAHLQVKYTFGEKTAQTHDYHGTTQDQVMHKLRSPEVHYPPICPTN